MSKAETAYRTITEVSELLQVQPSVLRFWETQFRQIKPLKRVGRRYYSAEDVVLLAQIRDDLYKEGYTIKGVQKRLRDKGKGVESASDTGNAQTDNAVAVKSADHLGNMIQELIAIRDSLKDVL